jgi:hypothetical protein
MANGNNTDVLKFAITALTALGTILFAVFNYTQNNAFSANMYYLLVGIITICIYSSLFFIIYLLVCGISMVVKTPEGAWDKLASNPFLYTVALMIVLSITNLVMPFMYYFKYIYYIEYLWIITILLFILYMFMNCIIPIEDQKQTYWDGALLLLPVIISTFIMFLKPNTTIFEIYSGYLYAITFIINFIITAIFITFCFIVIIKRKHLLIWGKHFLTLKQEQKKEFYSVLFLSIAVSMMIYPITMFSTYLVGDRVNISMKEINCKNDSMIPVVIQITGKNEGIDISLYQKHLIPNYSIKITPRINTSSPEIANGNDSTLIGNAMDISRYNIFINTSNLPVGYYEIVVIPLFNQSKSYSKGFYLLK